ncbi:EAL domain-containing protein [Cytobacillus luteolus]|nr:EAL domain-containing protein [Cytobacillus luteolus]
MIEYLVTEDLILHYFFNECKDMMFIIDRQGKIQLVNDASRTILGLTPKELIHTSLSAHIHPGDYHLWENHLQLEDEVLPAVNVECRLKQADRTYIKVFACLSPLYFQEQIIGFFVYFTPDLSYQSHYEHKIQETQELLKDITDELEIAIWAADISNREVLYMSENAIKVFGFSSIEFYNKPEIWFGIMHQEDLRDSFFKEGESSEQALKNREYRIFTPSGEIRWIREKLKPTFKNDKLIRLDGLSMDITEQKKTYEHITNVQRMGDVANWEYNITTNLIKYSPELWELLGVPTEGKQSVNSKVFWEKVYPEDVPLVRKAYREALVKNHLFDADFRFDQPTDGIKYFSAQGYVVRNEKNEPVELIGVIKCITEQKKKEVQLYKLIEHSFDVIAIINPMGYFTYISLSVETILGFHPSDVVGRHFSEFVPTLYFETAINDFQKVLDLPKRTLLFEMPLLHVDGSVRDIEISVTNLIDEWGIEGIVLNYRDITEKKKADQLINDLAYRDSLTHLPNRAFVTEVLEKIVGSEQFVLMFIDLDRFKIINDTDGHLVGDLALLEIANRMRACVRKDDILARIGGDEFLCVLKKATKDETKTIATRILSVLEQPISIYDKNYFVTSSIGISFSPEDGIDIETLIKKADTAMYVVKHSGKNNYLFFHPDMEKEIQKRSTIERELRASLQEKDFRIFYQPKIDTATNQIQGFEALIRWKYPPDVFIPIAEELGLINEIGAWVLEESIRQLKVWHEAGHQHLVLCINVSYYQLNNREFPELVKTCIHKGSIEPSLIELEITESMAMQNAEMTKGVFSRLNEIGVRIAIDDFGTGFSSLSYLQDFTFDTLKIDKSFIGKIGPCSKTNYIIQALITLSEALNVIVVAEGVETEEQLEFIKENGCDLWQGYLFSEPLPVDEANMLLEAENNRKDES